MFKNAIMQDTKFAHAAQFNIGFAILNKYKEDNYKHIDTVIKELEKFVKLLEDETCPRLMTF